MKGIVYYILVCIALLLLCISVHFAILSSSNLLQGEGEVPGNEGLISAVIA
ncbi:MAG: hypothetical protein OEM01_03345 [Desulfobulbaceae bacterium]|nr:hypothetical protein [Desulfobulbaceae bacterium]